MKNRSILGSPISVLAAALALALALVAALACGSVATSAPVPTARVSATAALEATPAPLPTAPIPSATGVPKYEPVTVLDGNGREFVFTEPPERIVAYDSAVVEILFAIGEGRRIVGTHDFVEYPAEASEVQRVGSAFDINVEAILALEPDLVFLFSPGFIENLSDAGLRVLYLPSRDSDFEDTAADIRLWGRIVGNPEAAEALAVDFEERVAAVRLALAGVDEGPRVFRDEGSLWTPGPDTLIGEVLTLLKLQNIAYDVSGFEQISPEVVVERDPEVIVATDFSTIDSDPAFADVAAIREGRVIRLEGEPLSVAGTRFVQGIEDLARQVYPELFP